MNNKSQKYTVLERLAQKACRFSLNNINLETIAGNTPDIVEYHTELQEAVNNLTTAKVKDVIKNWNTQGWPTFELNTVTSELDPIENNEGSLPPAILTDVKPVIFVMMKGALMKTLVDSGCERSTVNEDVVKSNAWQYEKVKQPIVLKMANGMLEPVFHNMSKTFISSDEFSGRADSLLMAPIKNYDLVLGRDFLSKYRARIILDPINTDTLSEDNTTLSPGVELWCEKKGKHILIPFGSKLKHTKTDYKDVVMPKDQFDKECEKGGKLYLYKLETVENKTTPVDNRMDPEREEKIKKRILTHIQRCSTK